MQSWSSKDFTADRAWGALDIANFSGTTVRPASQGSPSALSIISRSQ
jgi:hypothetical protein